MSQQKIPKEVTGAILTKLIDLLINLANKYLPISEIKSKRRANKRGKNTPNKQDE